MNRIRRCTAALVAVVALSGCGAAGAEGPGRTPSFPAEPGAWSRLPPSPLTARHEAAGGFLRGRYYVVGGWSGPPCPPSASCAAPRQPALRDGAAFDPATGHWERIAPAPTPVGGVLQLTVAGDRLYLLTGEVGRTDSPVSFLSYDPRRDAWSTLPAPSSTYPQLVAAGARVVAVGGTDEHGATSDAVFEPRTQKWHRLPDDPLGPSFGRTAAWLGNRLLLTGSRLVANPGADGPSLTRLAVLDATLTRWTLWPDSDIIGCCPVWVADRVVFPMTGSGDGGKVGNWGRDYANGAVLDPASGTWTPLPRPSAGGSGLEGTVGSVGRRTLVGGQLLDPQTRRWTRVPPAPWGRGYRTSQTIVPAPDGIFVWGGADEGANLSDGYLLRV